MAAQRAVRHGARGRLGTAGGPRPRHRDAPLLAGRSRRSRRRRRRRSRSGASDGPRRGSGGSGATGRYRRASCSTGSPRTSSRGRARRLDAGELGRRGVHSAGGADGRGIVERFIVSHLEEHVGQLRRSSSRRAASPSDGTVLERRRIANAESSVHRSAALVPTSSGVPVLWAIPATAARTRYCRPSSDGYRHSRGRSTTGLHEASSSAGVPGGSRPVRARPARRCARGRPALAAKPTWL